MHERFAAVGTVSWLPEHRTAHLAAIWGKRYLKRQQLLELGEPAVLFLTEVVHRSPQGWIVGVERMHQMLQELGAERMAKAFRAAAQA